VSLYFMPIINVYLHRLMVTNEIIYTGIEYIKHNNFIGLFNDFTIHELIYFIN